MEDIIFTVFFALWVLAIILLFHRIFCQLCGGPLPISRPLPRRKPLLTRRLPPTSQSPPTPRPVLTPQTLPATQPLQIPANLADPYVPREGQFLATAPALFLKSKLPIDILDPLGDPILPDIEKWFIHYKSEWLSTDYAQQLTSLVSRVIADREGNPITNVVCLGIGYFTPRNMQQLTIFSQIVAQLATVNPDLLNNIYIQDPEMTPEMRALFENHGCQVLDDPEAFDKLSDDANTFLVSLFLSVQWLVAPLRYKPYRNLAMFLGNGDSLLSQPMQDDPPYYREVIEGMLDDKVCKKEFVPCNYRNGRGYDSRGPHQGLQSLEIWWRACKPEPEQADQVSRA